MLHRLPSVVYLLLTSQVGRAPTHADEMQRDEGVMMVGGGGGNMEKRHEEEGDDKMFVMWRRWINGGGGFMIEAMNHIMFHVI